jgi:hypothetical protein
MNPLDRVTEAGLRRRRGARWAEYGPDVLPMWVAELAVHGCSRRSTRRPLAGPAAWPVARRIPGEVRYGAGLPGVAASEVRPRPEAVPRGDGGRADDPGEAVCGAPARPTRGHV